MMRAGNQVIIDTSSLSPDLPVPFHDRIGIDEDSVEIKDDRIYRD